MEDDPRDRRIAALEAEKMIAPKLSCGNKTESGKQTWQVIARVAATCVPRGRDLVQYICSKTGLAAVQG